jgi:hypothetical protein
MSHAPAWGVGPAEPPGRPGERPNNDQARRRRPGAARPPRLGAGRRLHGRDWDGRGDPAGHRPGRPRLLRPTFRPQHTRERRSRGPGLDGLGHTSRTRAQSRP